MIAPSHVGQLSGSGLFGMSDGAMTSQASHRFYFREGFAIDCFHFRFRL